MPTATELSLSQKQRLFAKLLPRLIDFIYDSGYECTLDWCYRPPEVAAMYAAQGKGTKTSLHIQHLAVDLNLFKDGVYLTSTEDHKLFGQYWKGLHSLCCWGGDFADRPDGNHYSITHEGHK